MTKKTYYSIANLEERGIEEVDEAEAMCSAPDCFPTRAEAEAAAVKKLVREIAKAKERVEKLEGLWRALNRKAANQCIRCARTLSPQEEHRCWSCGEPQRLAARPDNQ